MLLIWFLARSWHSSSLSRCDARRVLLSSLLYSRHNVQYCICIRVAPANLSVSAAKVLLLLMQGLKGRKAAGKQALVYAYTHKYMFWHNSCQALLTWFGEFSTSLTLGSHYSKYRKSYRNLNENLVAMMRT